jgi:hypothetical protein
MDLAILATGSPGDASVVRLAAQSGRVRDRIRVELLVDIRWLEPIGGGLDYFSTPWVPAEADEATRALFSELDDTLARYEQILAEGVAAYSVRRILAVPERAIERAARRCDLLLLPHPERASAEIRNAVRSAVATLPAPLLLVSSDGPIRGVLVDAEGSPGEPGPGWEFARQFLEGRAESVRVQSPLRVEEFAGVAPRVEESSVPRIRGSMPRANGDLLVILGATPVRGVVGRRSVGARRLRYDGNLLLIPA